MRKIASMLVVCAAAMAAPQQAGLQVAGKRVELGPPKAVAIGVDEVFWRADGKALAFYAKDADGSYLGVFNQETGKAKPVLRFAEGTNVHFEQWLPYRAMYVIAFSQPAGQGFRKWSIVTIDSRLLNAKTVWSAQYGEKEEVGLDFDVSPSRDHAIITVTDSKGATPVVLLDGALSAVVSRDLAQAWKQGARFAGWSVDGTAYYSAGGPTEVAATQFDIALNDLASSQQSSTIELKLAIDTGGVLGSVPIIGKFFKFAPVAPESGTPVYELMPNNATLRPVLSKGPFQNPETYPHVVYPKYEDTVATAQERRDGASALWMVGLTGVEGEPYTKDGVLIAVNASRFWMCDDGNWVAYESGGALFVRKITYGGQPYSPSLVTKG